MEAEVSRTKSEGIGSENQRRARFFHLIFKVAVLAKGVDGTVELFGGVLLLFLSPDSIWRAIYFLISGELTKDPADPLANLVLQGAPKVIQARFSASTFLLLHGAVKLGLVAGLATNRVWSYPAAILVFTAFTIYQIYALTQKYSLLLGAVTVLDVLITLSIVIEYNHVLKARQAVRGPGG